MQSEYIPVVGLAAAFALLGGMRSAKDPDSLLDTDQPLAAGATQHYWYPVMQLSADRRPLTVIGHEGWNDAALKRFIDPLESRHRRRTHQILGRRPRRGVVYDPAADPAGVFYDDANLLITP